MVRNLIIMKRGRPSLRFIVHQALINILENSEAPMNVLSLTKEASKILGRSLSWNTVQKYLKELIELDKVEPITLAHSKIEGKEGLTVFKIKR